MQKGIQKGYHSLTDLFAYFATILFVGVFGSVFIEMVDRKSDVMAGFREPSVRKKKLK